MATAADELEKVALGVAGRAHLREVLATTPNVLPCVKDSAMMAASDTWLNLDR